MDGTSQQQPGNVSVAIERTCDGRCCAVFPLSRQPRFLLEPPGSASYDAVFIADMLVPLTQYEAEKRYHDLGYGTLPEFTQALYTCRHWDTETRLCTAYDQRPWLCRDYPYWGDCDRKAEGCNYRQGLDYFIRCAKDDWDRLGGLTEEP
jgi:Fe-S-cluster containining protein